MRGAFTFPLELMGRPSGHRGKGVVRMPDICSKSGLGLTIPHK